MGNSVGSCVGLPPPQSLPEPQGILFSGLPSLQDLVSVSQPFTQTLWGAELQLPLSLCAWMTASAVPVDFKLPEDRVHLITSTQSSALDNAHSHTQSARSSTSSRGETGQGLLGQHWEMWLGSHSALRASELSEHIILSWQMERPGCWLRSPAPRKSSQRLRSTGVRRSKAICTNRTLKMPREQKQDTVHTRENALVKPANSHSRKLMLKSCHEGWGQLSSSEHCCSSRGPGFGSQHPCWATHNQKNPMTPISTGKCTYMHTPTHRHIIV